MSKTKKRLTVALVCVNLALVAALVLVAAAPNAQAQGVIGGTDYLVVTGLISSSTEAVYVIDIGRQAMAAWKYDKNAKKTQVIGARSLKDDFKR